MNNQPAFPQNTKIVGMVGQVIHEGFMGGMTLRDYFAAKALPSIIEDWYRDELYIGEEDNAEHIASLAYTMADAMIEARK